MTIEKQLAFSGDEFRRRLDCLRCVAASRGLDVVLLFNPSNTFYLTGFFSVNLWDFQCLIVPLSGEPMLVIREFETGRFKASCRLQEPWTYPPEGSGPAALIEALKHMKCERARLGVEMSRFLDAKAFAALSSGLPGTVFSDATDVLDDARAVKSTEEIVYLRRAAAITDSGMEAAVSAIRERCSDYAVAAEANRALLAGGSDFMCIDPIVATGQNSSLAHSTASGVEAAAGDQSPSVWYDLLREANTADADCLLLACTGVRTATIIEDVESELSKPLISASAVTVWRALRLAGYRTPVANRGILLRVH